MASKESRTRSTSLNILSGTANKIILLLFSFISRKIFIQYIGILYLGINSLFSNVLTVLSLADLGFGTAMAFSYYKPLAEHDEDRLASLTNFYSKIYNWIAFVVGGLGLALIPFLKYIIKTDTNVEHLYLFYVIALANTVVSYLFVYKSTIITADQKNYIVNKVAIRVNMAKYIVQIVTMILFANYILYTVIDLLGTLCNNFMISRQADKLYPFINRKDTIISEEEKKSIFSNIKSVFLYKFSASIMSGTDSIIMSAIVGTVSVGLYTNYLTITNQIAQFVQIVFSSFTASVGNLITENKSKKNYEVFKVMQMLSHAISGIIAVCLYTLIDDFIALWLGTEYEMGSWMILAVAANTFFTIALQPIWSYREATGLYNKTKYVMVVTAIANIVLSIIMGYAIGAPGVVIATVVSRVLTYFWYEPRLIYKLYFKKPVHSYFGDFLISLVIIVLSTKLCLLVFSIINGQGWFGWIVHGCIAVLIPAILYLIRYCFTPEFKFVLGKFKRVAKQG